MYIYICMYVYMCIYIYIYIYICSRACTESPRDTRAALSGRGCVAMVLAA